MSWPHLDANSDAIVCHEKIPNQWLNFLIISLSGNILILSEEIKSWEILFLRMAQLCLHHPFVWKYNLFTACGKSQLVILRAFTLAMKHVSKFIVHIRCLFWVHFMPASIIFVVLWNMHEILIIIYSRANFQAEVEGFYFLISLKHLTALLFISRQLWRW